MTILERIRQRYPTMTGALRAFADLVLAEPVNVARMSSHAAAKTIGVSVATANRFARAIGFETYPTFRANLIQSFASAYEPVKRLEREISKASTSYEIVVSCLREDIANLEQTIAMFDEMTCRQAVELIIAANRIFVVGFDNGAALAQVLANGLLQLKDNVARVSNGDGGLGVVRHLSRFDASDLVIAIAFPRYIKDTISLAALAKSREIPVLAITDTHHSPLAALAQVSLYACSERHFASVSNAAALSLIESLLAAVSHRTPASVQRAETFTSCALPWIEVGRADAGQKQ
ncbi:MurR/RpiR family transcriptional regulator [Microvirga brassicacearum]|uniref:MurR/RpiR family transcriptional regulator n=2 Tax=Microvirga brassicacearum TaxID=2580413 RepID=A0A5N3PEA2_9HYPH|nr:MurR/RpiR family transcriptional regulator [Microvirga brassicacearum]